MFETIQRNRRRYALARTRAREVALDMGLDSESFPDRIRAPLERNYRQYARESGGKSYGGIIALSVTATSTLVGAIVGYLAGNAVVGGVTGNIAGIITAGAVYDKVERIEPREVKPMGPVERKSIEDFLANKQTRISCLDAKLSERGNRLNGQTKSSDE